MDPHLSRLFPILPLIIHFCLSKTRTQLTRARSLHRTILGMKYTVEILITMVVVHQVRYEFVNTQQSSRSVHPPDSRGIPVWMFLDHSNERRTLAFRATQAIEMNLVACGPRKKRTDPPERPVNDAKRGHDPGHDLMERGTRTFGLRMFR